MMSIWALTHFYPPYRELLASVLRRDRICVCVFSDFLEKLPNLGLVGPPHVGTEDHSNDKTDTAHCHGDNSFRLTLALTNCAENQTCGSEDDGKEEKRHRTTHDSCSRESRSTGDRRRERRRHLLSAASHLSSALHTESIALAV